ncbi:MAG: DNA repair protein RecO C-terminal domain-containing protein, partial [Muribaculaceae bacterium]|nr:DNA repair protein RecO C-terminal domain-containing protein [Muribaculaceae bacterium]
MGAVSFAVPAGGGAGAARRRALLQPLTPLEVEATIRPGKELHTFREPRAKVHLHTVLMSPARSAVAMFLAEVLQNLLRQADADANTYYYIEQAVERLNDARVPVANFGLMFMRGLSAMLGIEPDSGDYRPGMIFDMIDGRFRRSAALHGHSLSVAESAAAARLLRMTWSNQGRFRFAAADRRAALERILEYYSLHYAPLTGLKSPSVLHELLR